jgi:Zn-dependent peptidase ImmA (M78 family)
MKTPRSVKYIRGRTENLLQEAGVSSIPVPLHSIADYLGVSIKYHPYEGELAGMIARTAQGAVVGINSLHPRTRQRFTLAHELGHFLLHSFDVHIDTGFRVKRRDGTSSLAVDPEEIEANRFAAELLMPFSRVLDDLIERDIDIESDEDIRILADRYQVSRQAMSIRISNLIDTHRNT